MVNGRDMCMEEIWSDKISVFVGTVSEAVVVLKECQLLYGPLVVIARS